MGDHETSARIRYSSSITCENSVCVPRCLENLLGRFLPKRKRRLLFDGAYLLVYSSRTPNLLLAELIPSMHTHSIWKPLSRHPKEIKFYVSARGGGAKSVTISCRFIDREAAINWCRMLAVYEAKMQKEKDILEVLDLYSNRVVL